MNIQTVSLVEFKRISVFRFRRFPAHGLRGTEILAGHHRIGFAAVGVRLVGNELRQPADGLLRVPGEGVSIDVNTCLCGCFHIVLHLREIHVAVAIHHASHLHGVACHRLGEVGVGHLIDRRFLEILIHGRTSAQLEVGVLGVVNILFQRLVLVQVAVVVVVGLALLIFLLCRSRYRQTGCHQYEAPFSQASTCPSLKAVGHDSFHCFDVEYPNFAAKLSKFSHISRFWETFLGFISKSGFC